MDAEDADSVLLEAADEGEQLDPEAAEEIAKDDLTDIDDDPSAT